MRYLCIFLLGFIAPAFAIGPLAVICTPSSPAPALPTPPANAVTFSNVQNGAGWHYCNANNSCNAGGTGSGTQLLTQGVASPSRSGSSMQLTSTGTTVGGYWNTLFSDKTDFPCSSFPGGTCSGISAFEVDYWVYYAPGNTSYLNAYEYDPDLWGTNQQYFVSQQFHYYGTQGLNLWNMQGNAWVSSGLPLPSIAEGVWHHHQMYATVNQTAQTYTYVDFIYDGAYVYHNLGTTYNIGTNASSPTMQVEMQLDGAPTNGTLTEYVDDYTFIVWGLTTPTASPVAGSYSSAQSVVLTAPTGTICYTVDGSTPTGSGASCTHGTTYSTAIPIASTTTLKAIATYPGNTSSAVYSGTYTITGASSATPMLLAGNGSVGNNAIGPSIPTLAFGYQQTGTASAALPISISNCSNAQYSAFWGTCGGTGSLTVSSMALSGTNAADFAITGTCGTIASGADCEPTLTFTPSTSAAEAATLTVNYAGGIASQTMSLTGTGLAAASALPACGSTLAANTLYQATADVTCPGTAYILGGSNIDVNLNGHTLTYNNVSSSQLATITAYSASGGTITLTVNSMATPFTAAQKVAMNFPSITGATKCMNGTQYAVLSSPAPTATSFAVTESCATGSGSVSGTVSPDIQTNAFQLASYTANVNVHNGTITSGASGNLFSKNNHDGAIDELQGYGFGALNVNNVTFNLNQQFQAAVHVNQVSGSETNLNINSTASGSCANVGCRNLYQSSMLSLTSTGTVTVTGNALNGGPQGGIHMDAAGTVAYNYINPGSATGNNTNDFGIYAQHSSLTVNNNSIMVPMTANSNARGLIISGAEGTISSMTVQDNLIAAKESATNFEYNGCQSGGAYGQQWDDSPSASTATHGDVTAISNGNCPASGLRLTDVASSSNTSSGYVYRGERTVGQPTCVANVDTNSSGSCGWGASLDGPTAFLSTGDTFVGDNADFLFDVVGASGIIFQSPTFSVGPNPQNFHTFTAVTGIPSQGGGSVTNVHFVDPVYNAGTSPTDLNVPAQNPTTPNMGAVTFYPADWTQTMQVNKASGPAVNGAVVTWTDAAANTYTCTTNASGACTVVLSQYQAGNMTGANQAISLNPYSLGVTASGCTADSESGLTISATGTKTVSLSGC